MKSLSLFLVSFSICLAGGILRAEESMPNGKPRIGIINDLLRKESPAASAWDIGLQFRVRSEARDAGSFPNRDFAHNLDHSNDYFLFRTKVHLGWTPAKWITAYVEGRDAQDVSDSRTIPESDRFDVYQAYVRLGDLEGFPFSLKAGRQELIYGEQRHIGNGDWSNPGRSFDSVKLRYQKGDFWLDAFIGRPVLAVDGLFNNVNHHDLVSGLYGSTRRVASWQETEFFIIARNVGARSLAVCATGPRDIYTVGTRMKSIPDKLGNWDYSFEAAKQFGSILQNGQRLDHNAYALNAGGGRKWNRVFGSPRLGLSYDFGSGDSNPADNRNGTFEMLFGTNHRFYGNMDLTGLRNMHIPKMEGSINPAKKVTVSAEWLGFWLADTADYFYPESGPGRSQNGYGRNQGYGTHVGQEVDLLVDWRPVTWGQARMGYGHFFIGDYIRRSINSVPANGGAVNANWFYMQVSIDF
jgi:hypothetical protein